MKSNGWTDGTAALQLFAHLDGEALNVALLRPEEERGKWEGLSQGLSDYYDSPGRLAVFPAAIRERDSPTGNGSRVVRHRTGNPRRAGIRRHGQACPGLDDQGQIHCGSMEPRVASTSRWGFLGCSHPRHCGSLPSVGELFGTGAELGGSSGAGQDSLGEYCDSRMSPDGFAGAHGVYGNGLVSASTRGWCHSEER